MDSTPPLRRLHLLILFAIILLGAALRLEAIALTVVDQPVRADARTYYYTAWNLRHWRVFSRAEPGPAAPSPDAYAPPVIPVVISALLEAPPATHMLLQFNLIQALLGTLTIALTFLLFRDFAGTWPALGAALLTAVSPHLINLGVYLLTETLFTFFLIGGLYFLALARRTEHEHRQRALAFAVAGGAVLGLTALTRATTAFLPWFMLVFLWWQTRSPVARQGEWRRVVVPAVVAALLVSGAWTVRNLVSLGATGDPELMIRSLHHGIYPGFLFQGDPATLGVPYAADPFSAHARTVRDVLQELLRRASADPWTYLQWYLFGKPVMLLSWNMVDGWGEIFVYPVFQSPYFGNPLFQLTLPAVQMLHAPLSIAGVVGAAILLWRPEWLGVTTAGRFPAALVVMVLVYFLLVHMVGAPFPRYGVPLRPLVYGLGVFTLARLGHLALSRARLPRTA